MELKEVSSGIGFLGNMYVVLKDEITGEVTKTPMYKNKFTQAFLNKLAQWMIGTNNTGQNAITPPTQFQVGTGTGTVGVNDAALFTPVTASLVTVGPRSYSSGVGTITINYPAGVLNGTYTECGLLDAAGVLLTHLLLSPNVQVNSSQSATFVYTLTPQSV